MTYYYLCGAEIEKKMHIIFFIYIFLFRGKKKGGGQCIGYIFDLLHTSSDS